MRTERLARTAALGVAIALGVFAREGTSAAFCRTTTVPAPPDRDVTNSGCWPDGAPLFHPSKCVPYMMLARESPKVPNNVLSNSLARAFGAWSAPNDVCTPGFTAIELPPVSDATIVGFTTGQRDHNVIGFVSPWPHNDASEPLALATLTFNPSTGEVLDADMEINGDVAWSTSSTPPPDGIDLDSVLTHEAGHFLGLAHSVVANATMSPVYEPGTTEQRTLAADDMQAICVVYPSRDTRATAAGLVASTECQLVPGVGGEGCGDPQISHGCAMAVPRGGCGVSGLAGFAAAAIVVTSAAFARRRRGARRR